MAKLIECIPNCSEGRDPAVIGALADAAGGVAGAALLDCSPDADHNRSVFTLLGSPEGVAEAAFRLCRAARDAIDMTRHEGAHPCMGAIDVIPFVPVRDVAMSECVEISVRVARRIYDELGVPCFLYEESCARENRRDLADIRRGGFWGMPRKLLEEEWAPDFGERRIHPTAGATAVGARAPLVAFNVNLATSDVAVAKRIARKIRASNGGFKYCKAIGVMLESRGFAQVSMNMVNYRETPLFAVFDAICEEAVRYGVGVVNSEIVGLVPSEALMDSAVHYLRLAGFEYKRRTLEPSVEAYLSGRIQTGLNEPQRS